MSGAWVSRARLQAADGMPMPTKQMSLLLSARAAAIVIISLAVCAIRSSFRRAFLSRGMHGDRIGAAVEHVGLHPGEKAVAIAGDRVPRNIIGIVARVVAMRI